MERDPAHIYSGEGLAGGLVPAGLSSIDFRLARRVLMDGSFLVDE